MSAVAQRLVAGLLLGLVVAAVVFGGVLPLVAAFEERAERIATLEDRVDRFSRIAARGGEVSAELAQVGDSELLQLGSFTDSTAALAAAGLQESLRELVAGAGGEVTSVRVLPEREAEHFGVIGVEARLRLDVAGLRQVLYRLESGERILRVDRLLVRSLQRGVRRSNLARGGIELLDVQLELLGYRQLAEAGGG